MDELFDPRRRRRLVLKRGRERAVANRHPWIFAGAIAEESGPDEAAIADLVDGSGAHLASGLHSLHSQIRMRALTFGAEALTPELLRARIAAAIARRRALFDEATNAARVVHAEGDELSGLVVDRYDDLVVVEIANEGLERLKPLVVAALQEELTPRLIYFKNDIAARKLEHLSLEPQTIGDGEAATTILENGLRFNVDVPAGQKTGFFLDQRDNRALARANARGRRVSFIKRLTAGEDHPVSLFCPEGEYLKGFLLEVTE